MKKYLKIFVVCFALVALLTVSCFATSAQTTSTTAAYGHYISPGDYAFNDLLDFSTFNRFMRFNFVASGHNYIGVYFYPDDGTLYFVDGEPTYEHNQLVYSNGQWISEDYRFFTVDSDYFIYDSLTYSFFISNIHRLDTNYDNFVLDSFLSSFGLVGQWISGAANILTSMFWSNNSLTFLGTLAVSALAFAVAFLIIGLISRFLRFRG